MMMVKEVNIEQNLDNNQPFNLSSNIFNVQSATIRVPRLRPEAIFEINASHPV